jgi:hypothetical protein
MNIYYSPDLFDLFSDMDNDVARFLLSIHDTCIPELDINLLDIDKQNIGCLTFTKNVRSNLNLENSNYHFSNESAYNPWKISRNSIRIGKFVKKFQKFSNVEIETFVNLFKASTNQPNETIELVSGEDIRYWYNESNYYISNGTLGSSCMRNKEYQSFFDIYTMNPESCNLLIIKRNNKIVARALVWKIHKIKLIDYNISFFSILNNHKLNKKLSNYEYVIDKCYYITDHYHTALKNFAKKNNWIIREDGYKFTTYDQEEKKYKKIYLRLEVKLNKLEFNKYPYMDTFARYNSKKGILYNDSDSSKIGHILKSTYGSYKNSKTRWEYFIKYFC